jgi:hypothetical protein
MATAEVCHVAVIGAGPYGLSTAAHLRSRGVPFRIFGSPMHAWRAHMAAGMFLKSEGCASNLSDPAARLTLDRFCAEEGLAYGEYAVPVPLDTFAKYGLEFQRRLVPELEQAEVVALDKPGDTFQLRLDSGEIVRARRVVVAVGLTYFSHVPATLRGMPPELVSHSSRHSDLAVFAGRDVTVIGAGQSALESAALLHEQGADVRVLVRRPSVAWNAVPSPRRRPLRQRLRRPPSGLGFGWRTLFYSEAPMAFYRLPREFRLHAVRTVLGPAGAWWLKERVVDRLPLLQGRTVLSAEAVGDRMRLRLDGLDGTGGELLTDHVIAATGYRVDLGAIPFIRPAVLARLRRIERAPALSPNFESSVEGLYFLGLASANNFGPVMRFVFGADYTARQVARDIVAASQNGHRGRPRQTTRRPPMCRV